ncbi:MAG TPA: DUF503 domain-containing protein [Anaerovoracaceae bacterium]|nr:DUF503 domain-containing protein [Anaerovoracaceae bacterium]
MIIGTMKIKIYAPWVHSLKEKRMVVKSICAKAGSKFNISIAEVEDQDMHQSIVIGLTCVTDEISHCNSILDNVLYFIEENTEAEILKIDREII